MFSFSKTWKLIFALSAFANGVFGYSSVSFWGNTLGFDDAGRLNDI